MTPILLNGTQKDPLMGHSYLDRGGWGKRKEWVRIGQVKMSSAKRSGLFSFGRFNIQSRGVWLGEKANNNEIIS